MTTAQAAKRYEEITGQSITPKRIIQLIHAHKLPAQKVGRDWHIDPKVFEVFARTPRKPGKPATSTNPRNVKRRIS